MARQQGILKFKGNIGSFSMYKTQDGFQGREKSGIEPGRVLNFIAQLPGATHCTLIAAGAELDFASGEYAFDEATAEIALGPQTEPARTLTVNTTPGSTKSLFLTFGITFTQIVNGESYALKNGFYNGMAIVAVDNTI